jgi:glutamate dehydrogenase/leucine dehydrogenase
MRTRSFHIQHAEGVDMVIAIDSFQDGPALGGCRWQPYPDVLTARRDAFVLARAMTQKAALAQISLGGGRAIVAGDPARRSPAQLRAFGEFVGTLGGRFIAAPDMGVGPQEMATIAEVTPHVVGLPETLGGCGEPAPYAAEGVRLAMEVALASTGRALSGARVAVQGVGHVGASLVGLLLDSGVEVAAADVASDALDSLPEAVARLSPQEILTADCDVLAPCGPPGVLGPRIVPALRCQVICGAADSPLAEPEVAKQLSQRGILYVPGYLANAGGMIHLAVALGGEDSAETRRRLQIIPRNLEQVLARAAAEGSDPATAADELALARLAERGHPDDLR